MSRFEIEALRRLRQGARLASTVEYYDQIDSTNSRVRALGRSGAAEGTVVIAEQQSAGRGRLGRSWASPPGRNLYMSVLLRPPVTLEVVPQLTLVAGLATAQAAREWVASAGIKWPNDILVEGKKVAGILTEMEAAQGRVAFVVVGIGVNLNIRSDEFPPELRDKAAGLAEFLEHAPIERHRFADRLLTHLEHDYLQFVEHGFAALRPAWDQLSLLTGRSVRIDAGGQLVEGVVLGIAEDGTLRLHPPSGAELRVVAGAVTVLDGYQ